VLENGYIGEKSEKHGGEFGFTVIRRDIVCVREQRDRHAETIDRILRRDVGVALQLTRYGKSTVNQIVEIWRMRAY
jgi:hypothetical protein